MTDQTPKRITIDAPSEATILAARHLDAAEGRVQVGSTVDTSTRSAITTVLRYIARAHNMRAAIPTRDDPTRYDRLSPLARALVDDYDALDLAEMLVKTQDELAALRAVARGYCPHCGRGDAAPTATDWEQQRDRADHAEAELRCYTEADSADAAAGSYAMRAETAERELAEARQHLATAYAQRDRLRIRMNALADRWDAALAVDKPYARTLREEINCAPFDPEGAMTVQEYTERGHRLWAFRCWGTDTCDGWLGLGHHTQNSALAERERHAVEAHTAPAPAATETTAWTPPPPSDRREQLPNHLLALINVPAYLSTACEAADALEAQMPKHTHRRIELGEHADRLHSRCRINNKFTGVSCRCCCHGTPDTTKRN